MEDKGSPSCERWFDRGTGIDNYYVEEQSHLAEALIMR